MCLLYAAEPGHRTLSWHFGELDPLLHSTWRPLWAHRPSTCSQSSQKWHALMSSWESAEWTQRSHVTPAKLFVHNHEEKSLMLLKGCSFSHLFCKASTHTHFFTFYCRERYNTFAYLQYEHQRYTSPSWHFMHAAQTHPHLHNYICLCIFKKTSLSNPYGLALTLMVKINPMPATNPKHNVILT